MIPFVIGLFIGAFLGFIFASILGMSRDGDEYARRKQYGRDLTSETVKAARVQNYGGPEAVRVEDVSLPAPGRLTVNEKVGMIVPSGKWVKGLGSILLWEGRSDGWKRIPWTFSSSRTTLKMWR